MACSSISRHELSASSTGRCTCLICHAAGVVSGPGKATHWHRIARRAAPRQSHHRKRKRITAPLVARGEALIDPVPQEAALRVLHRVESLPPLVEIATRVAHRVRILTEYQWSRLVCMSRARPVAHRAAVRRGALPCDHVLALNTSHSGYIGQMMSVPHSLPRLVATPGCTHGCFLSRRTMRHSRSMKPWRHDAFLARVPSSPANVEP